MSATAEVSSSGLPIVICGGGIIGVSTAYYLSLSGARVVLVEAYKIAGCASGKAGGFLARHWRDRTPMQELSRTGFDLHESLAMELNLSSYRTLPSVSVSGRGRSQTREIIDENTAQVTPLELASAMWDAAKAKGAELVKATVTGLQMEEGNVTGVRVGRDIIRCSHALIAMGPWSVFLEHWLVNSLRIPMIGTVSTSMVFDSCGEIDQVALFCDDDRRGIHPEVYPRPDSSVYVCGCGGSPELCPDEVMKLLPSDVAPNLPRAKAAVQSLDGVCGITQEPTVTQACIRPLPEDGLPIMGSVTPNLHLCCGHDCWGILWGPVSGKSMAELILTKNSSIDLAPFSPHRFVST